MKFSDPNGEKVYVNNIANQAERDELLRRVNYTYGCEGCVTIDDQGYLQVDTSNLSDDIVNATSFLTGAINTTKQYFDVQITNNNNEVQFGDSQPGMGNVTVINPDGTSRKISSVLIRLDFEDDQFVKGGSESDKASFLNMIFAHEVSHFYPSFKIDPAERGAVGDVDAPINEIRLARGLPLRAEYQAHSVGPLATVQFGEAVRDDKGKVVRGTDGIQVTKELGRILVWVQRNVKR